MTQAERLARIETLLEELKAAQLLGHAELKASQTLGHAALTADIGVIKTELRDDKADLAALKNKGIGLVIGIGLVAAALGAKINAVFSAALGSLK